MEFGQVNGFKRGKEWDRNYDKVFGNVSSLKFTYPEIHKEKKEMAKCGKKKKPTK